MGVYDIEKSIDWIVNHIREEVKNGNISDMSGIEDEIAHRVEIELEEIGKKIYKYSLSEIEDVVDIEDDKIHLKDYNLSSYDEANAHGKLEIIEYADAYEVIAGHDSFVVSFDEETGNVVGVLNGKHVAFDESVKNPEKVAEKIANDLLKGASIEEGIDAIHYLEDVIEIDKFIEKGIGNDLLSYDLKDELIDSVRAEIDNNLYNLLKGEQNEELQDFFSRLEFSNATDTSSWNRAMVDAYSDLVTEASKLYFKREYGSIEEFIKQGHGIMGGWELDEETITECVNYIESFLEDESYTANLNIRKPVSYALPRI